MSFKPLALLAGVALLAGATAAPAATVTFDLTGNSWISGADGNARFYDETDDGVTVNVRVTGWSFDGSTVRNSFLGAYSHGLGVTSGDENGFNNTHTLDNHNRIDFLLLQFDQAVEFDQARFNPFGVYGAYTDTDATFAVGTNPLPWNGPLPFDETNGTALNALFANYFSSTGGGSSNTRAINPDDFAGNFWLVAPDFGGPTCYYHNCKIDGFKFTGLTVSTVPIPEPGTWAMMIAGFGLAGAALRRRPARASAPATR